MGVCPSNGFILIPRVPADMEDGVRELGFDVLLALASGIALAAYTSGVLFDPLPVAAVGFVLAIGGVMTLVSPRARETAAAIGCVAVGLAGIVTPRVVESFPVVPVTNDPVVTLIGSGLILLLAFALLRLTAFSTPDRIAA